MLAPLTDIYFLTTSKILLRDCGALVDLTLPKRRSKAQLILDQDQKQRFQAAQLIEEQSKSPAMVVIVVLIVIVVDRTPTPNLPKNTPEYGRAASTLTSALVPS